jgi:hypothetical protein
MRTCPPAALALFLSLDSLAAADPGAWEPERTYAFFAGVLEWQDRNLSPFPKKDRADRQLERKLLDAGVPAANVVFLEDRAATQKAMQESLRDLAGKAGEGSTFVFYYAGHGMQDDGGEVYLANYDADTGKKKATCVAVSDVSRILKTHFRGHRLLLFADCCYSGALAKVVKDFEGIEAACFTSATASNVSTAEWTFTAALVSIFEGDPAADGNGDGRITLREADAWVAAEMRFKEGQLTRAALTSRTDGGFSLRGIDAAMAVKEIPGPWKVRQYCEVEWKGDWYRAQVLDGRDGECRIHYIGWGAEDDEWVKHARMRKPQGLGISGGDKVQVEWKGKWWDATVMRVEGDFAFVHYDGWGDEWDEWVTGKRLRKK